MESKYLFLLLVLTLSSCALKKDIHYIQDAAENNSSEINYQITTIQPNDILSINVESVNPEAAIPYNRGATGAQVANIQLLQLQGYLVSNTGFIKFPVLGEIELVNLTTSEAEEKIRKELVDGGHLISPIVNLRIVNAKITVLGEVRAPGTYNFTEQNITLLQALGYAGDLTINGKRDDVIITRDVEGVRKITHVDLTNTEFMDTEYYYVRPNDVIIVNQNPPRVKSAGFVGNVGTFLAVTSVILSSIILVTR